MSRSTPELLAAAARERPDDVLLTFIDDGTDYTLRTAYEQTLRWAGALRRLGVGPNDVVAVMMPNHPDAYFAWFGTAWLRAIEAPLNTEYRGTMLVHVLNVARTRVAIVSRAYVDRFVELADRLETLQTIVVPDDEGPGNHPRFTFVGGSAFFAGVAPAHDLTPPVRSDLSGVVYTSGTTGVSKGVLMSWDLLEAFGPSMGPNTGAAFRMYSAWSGFHNSGKFALAEAIRRSGRLFLRQRFRTPQFWPDIRATGATVAGLLGGISNFLWSQPPAPDDADNPLESVLMAPVIPQYREFERRFGLRIHSGYATSEVGLPMDAPYPLPNHRTCGRVRPEYEVRIVDPEGNDVGPDAVGEALVRSSNPKWLCDGYLNMPEKTAEAYAGGWFHTGDGLMYDADGNYYFVDRVKDCIRRRGENISSFEVENEVNAHPAVLESAAFEVKGEDGDGEVMILVVRHGGTALTERELVEFLIPRMPRFMIPRFVEFIDELPKTHTNRMRKIELRERGRTPATWDRVSAGVVVPA